MSLLRRLFNAGLQGALLLLGRRWRPIPSESVQRIVVLELTRLGDVCAAASLLQPLQRAYPLAKIEMVVQEAYTGLLEDEVDEVHGLPGAGWAFLQGAWALRKRLMGPSLMVVSASPAIRHSVLVWLSRPGWALGFLFPPRPSLRYDTPGRLSAWGIEGAAAADWTGEGHLLERCQAVLRAGGIKASLPTPFLRAAAERRFGSRRVVLHAGANWQWRRWPLERFAALAEALQVRGFDCVLIPAEAGPLLSAPAGVRVAEGLSLVQLRELLAGALLFIGNDSGPMHLAAALGTPCLALFGPNLVERSGPWPLPSQPESPHVALREPVPCSPCGQTVCVQPHDWCMAKLSLARVQAQALELLNAPQEG